MMITKPANHGQRTDITCSNSLQNIFVIQSRGRSVCLYHCPFSSVITPVIAATTCSGLVVLVSNVADPLTQTQDNHPVGDIKDFCQIVADHNDTQISFAQF